MAIINIAIEASLQDFSIFADELGYMPMVILEVGAEPIPNPKSKEAFLLEYFKRVTVTELARVKIANIQRQVDVAKEAEKVAMRTAIEGVVTVTAQV